MLFVILLGVTNELCMLLLGTGQSSYGAAKNSTEKENEYARGERWSRNQRDRRCFDVKKPIFMDHYKELKPKIGQERNQHNEAPEPS